MIGQPRNMKIIEKIRKGVKEAGEEGIWIFKLSENIKESEQQINYYVDGKISREKEAGGFLKDEIMTKERLGKNRILVMR